jgi:5,10-methenyltetrahydrofolate synthetase
MGKATWGIAEPLPEKPLLEPDVVLVPLLAFDIVGYRLGYGGGFYDRTLAACCIQARRRGRYWLTKLNRRRTPSRLCRGSTRC